MFGLFRGNFSNAVNRRVIKKTFMDDPEALAWLAGLLFGLNKFSAPLYISAFFAGFVSDCEAESNSRKGSRTIAAMSSISGRVTYYGLAGSMLIYLLTSGDDKWFFTTYMHYVFFVFLVVLFHVMRILAGAAVDITTLCCGRAETKPATSFTELASLESTQ